MNGHIPQKEVEATVRRTSISIKAVMEPPGMKQMLVAGYMAAAAAAVAESGGTRSTVMAWTLAQEVEEAASLSVQHLLTSRVHEVLLLLSPSSSAFAFATSPTTPGSAAHSFGNMGSGSAGRAGGSGDASYLAPTTTSSAAGLHGYSGGTSSYFKGSSGLGGSGSGGGGGGGIPGPTHSANQRRKCRQFGKCPCAKFYWASALTGTLLKTSMSSSSTTTHSNTNRTNTTSSNSRFLPSLTGQ